MAVSNDADVVAAGIAATHGQLDQLVRVWTLGNGIGFGSYPVVDGVWEGGHVVVTLDPNEHFCGCGGAAIWKASWVIAPCGCGFSTWSRRRSSRCAKAGDRAARISCMLWHRALAAATSSIHMAGPGKFFISGSMRSPSTSRC